MNGGGFLSNLFGGFLKQPSDVPKKSFSSVYSNKDLRERLEASSGNNKDISNLAELLSARKKRNASVKSNQGGQTPGMFEAAEVAQFISVADSDDAEEAKGIDRASIQSD